MYRKKKDRFEIPKWKKINSAEEKKKYKKEGLRPDQG